MFLLDAPYVSDFLKQSVNDLGQSVLDTPGARRFTKGTDIELIDEVDFASRLGAGERVLANSENALAHIFECGCNEDLTRQIDTCKDKALFRETIAALHPCYKFLRATVDELADLDISDMPCPFIVKPARGFFSLGVHVVNDHKEWPQVVERIQGERESMNREYPEEVVNSSEYIIEEGIDGEEYAIDVYYEEDGTPVITNILHHHFMSEDDVSDRLYYTSTKIIRDRLESFTKYAARVGEACDFHNFAIHIEVRVDVTGGINSIEANPLRFAGWCVADITYHAWGFNPYEYYFKGLRPDWNSIMQGRDDMVCAMVIADMPGLEHDTVDGFDYDAFSGMFDNMLELRKIDYTEYPVFAFAFAQMDEAGLAALKEDLKDDFSRFVITK